MSQNRHQPGSTTKPETWATLTLDIPEGYRMTELGPLPEEWRVMKLGDLFEIQQGKALSRKKDKGIRPRPFLRTANVLWGKIDLSNLDLMDFSEEEEKKYALLSGDLLVCEGGETGRTAFWDGQLDGVYYQNHLHRLRSILKDTEPRFYMYWLQAALTLLGLYGGAPNKTTIPNLSRSRLASFSIPLPPFPEQQAISYVLHTVQWAKEATERVIQATRELKKSLMRHLFTYGPVPVSDAEKVPLKDTEIGLVPEHWKVKILCEVITQAQYGLSQRGSIHHGKYPILRMNNLHDGTVNIHELQYVDLNKQLFLKFRLNKGDLLFNRTNSHELVGKTALFNLPGNYVFASYLIRIVPDTSKLTSEFLNYYLNAESTQAQLKLLASRGVSQSNISATKLKSFKIPVPPLSEQWKITRILQAVDQKFQAEEARKQALEALFKALLHHLMTGKIRVTDLTIPETREVV